jgi:hypothetical protein
MTSTFVDSLFILVAVVIALLVEVAVQIRVMLRWFKNQLLSLIE